MAAIQSVGKKVDCTGPYLGFFVCGGKLGFREISDQYSYKKQPSKIRHYVRKKTFSFPGGGNCPLRPPAMYGPVVTLMQNVMYPGLYTTFQKFQALFRVKHYCQLSIYLTFSF